MLMRLLLASFHQPRVGRALPATLSRQTGIQQRTSLPTFQNVLASHWSDQAYLAPGGEATVQGTTLGTSQVLPYASALSFLQGALGLALADPGVLSSTQETLGVPRPQTRRSQENAPKISTGPYPRCSLRMLRGRNSHPHQVQQDPDSPSS